MVCQVVRAETRCFNTVPTNSLQIMARSIELTSQSRGIKSDRVGSGSSLRTWASREYFPRAEEELVPPRVVAKGEVKDERHQVADVLYRDRLGMGMGVGVGIEVGQGSSLMEKERIMKGRGSTVIIGLDGCALQSDVLLVNGVLANLGSGGGFVLSSLQGVGTISAKVPPRALAVAVMR